MAKYIPKKGDIVYLSFDPTAGHEQKGYRPALILSSNLFNQKTGLALVCPITNTDRGYPLHLKIDNTKISGLVMVDQVRTIDYKARNVKFVAKASARLVNDVAELLIEILDLQ